MEGKYLVDHLLGWIRWPYLSANAGIWHHLFSGTVYWICGSSFTVGEMADCPVAKTVSPTSPTTAASHIPTSASTIPRARKVISNSADLVTKLVDPPIISLRKSMRLNSTLRRSRSTPNQHNESILVLKSALVSSLQFCGESLLGLPLVLTVHSRIPSRPSTHFGTKPTDNSSITPAGHYTVLHARCDWLKPACCSWLKPAGRR